MKWTWLNVTLVVINLSLVACGGASVQIDEWWHDDNVRLADSRHGSFAGRAPDQGAMTLFDRSQGKQWFEIGAYNYGWTIQTPHRVEFHTGHEVSIHTYGDGNLPRFQVRNSPDTKAAVWMNGNSKIGTQDLPLSFHVGSYNGGSDELARFNKSGDFKVTGDIILDGQSLRKRLRRIESNL